MEQNALCKLVVGSQTGTMPSLVLQASTAPSSPEKRVREGNGSDQDPTGVLKRPRLVVVPQSQSDSVLSSLLAAGDQEQPTILQFMRWISATSRRILVSNPDLPHSVERKAL